MISVTVTVVTGWIKKSLTFVCWVCTYVNLIFSKENLPLSPPESLLTLWSLFLEACFLCGSYFSDIEVIDADLNKQMRHFGKVVHSCELRLISAFGEGWGLTNCAAYF